MARVEGTRRPLCVLMSVLMSVLTPFTSSTSSDALTSMATFDYFYNWSIPASLLQPASVAMTTSKLRCASMCGLTPGCKGFVFSCLTSHPAHTCECYVSLNVNVSSGYPSTGSNVGLLVEGGRGLYGCGLRPTVWQRTAVTYTGTNHGDVANYSCRYARRVCEGHHHHLLHQRRVADADYSVCTCVCPLS
ncbi:uncharacterized protein LOC112569566 [Pomacea canaliculata]|uniref:uncharacterized protein LOC112569566 n=1 Tax=Pomacea canaliculata TaxID=400727 RepID=UPI000D72E794|nr:uncharacterized protein LOC112569566 [Pomacea canaliculata]